MNARTIGSLLLGVVAVFAAIAALAVALIGARQDIDGLRVDRAALTTNMNEANVTISALIEDLSDARSEIAGLRDIQAQLQTELEGGRETIGTLTADKAQLQSDFADVSSEIAILVSTKRGLQTELEEGRETIGTLTADKAQLQSELEEGRDTIDVLTEDKAKLQSDVNTLTDELETLENLHDSVEELREEVADLELKREPLILKSSVRHFACTGSMEPKLTCLDEATLLDNWKPEDIVIGTTISFYPTRECDLDGDRIVHRVVDIKIEDGVHYYWPKGDNNSEPDGCWIPETLVNGYIIEIHKDVRLENAELRQGVNDALDDYDAALEVYEKANEEYEDYCDRWDRWDDPDVCTLSSDRYRQGLKLFEKVEAAEERLDAATDYADCWVSAAENAIYYSDGRLPLYPLCLKRFVFDIDWV